MLSLGRAAQSAERAGKGIPPELSIHGTNEEKEKHDTGHHLSWDGKVPERSEGGKVVKRYKSKMESHRPSAKPTT